MPSPAQGQILSAIDSSTDLTSAKDMSRPPSIEKMLPQDAGQELLGTSSASCYINQNDSLGCTNLVEDGGVKMAMMVSRTILVSY